MAFSLAGGQILLSYADTAVTKLMSKVWSNWLPEASIFLIPICGMLVLSNGLLSLNIAAASKYSKNNKQINELI